jgi:hypothetical protein
LARALKAAAAALVLPLSVRRTQSQPKAAAAATGARREWVGDTTPAQPHATAKRVAAVLSANISLSDAKSSLGDAVKTHLQHASSAPRRPRSSRPPSGKAATAEAAAAAAGSEEELVQAAAAPMKVRAALCLHCERERERVDLVGSHGRWKRPCLQTAHMTI